MVFAMIVSGAIYLSRCTFFKKIGFVWITSFWNPKTCKKLTLFGSEDKSPNPIFYGSGTSMSTKIMIDLLSKYATHLKVARKLRLVPLYGYDSSRAVSGGWTDILSGDSSFAGVETNNLLSLSPPDINKEFVSIPLVRSTLSIGHNVPECSNDTLVLSLQNIALIFSNNITQWNDTRLVSDAPCLNNANFPITTLYRTTRSAATFVFTRILHSLQNGEYFSAPPNMSWPYPTPGMGNITANDFMLFRIRISNHSIGYLPWSTQDPYFSIKYAAIKPSSSAGPIIMSSETIKTSSEWLEIQSDPEAIPICDSCWPFLATSYIAMRKKSIQPLEISLNSTLPASCINMKETSLFVKWALDHLPNLTEYASISSSLKKQALNTMNTLECNGNSLLDTNFIGKLRWQVARTSFLIGLGIFGALISVGMLIMAYNEYLYARDLKLLAAVVGDDNYTMEAHLLNELNKQTHDHTGIELEDGDLTLPDEEEDARLLPTMGSSNFGSSVASSFASKTSYINSSSHIASSSMTSTSKLGHIMPHKEEEEGSQSSNLNLIPLVDLAIGKMIGSGSFGDVFKAKYRRKTVAVKRISVTQDVEFVQSFLKEVRSMFLDHPHVLKLIGFSVQAPYTYIISEYCKNGSLDRYMQKNLGQVVPFLNRISWMVQVAEGMAYLHSQQVTHRDLKLNNLLLDGNMQVKIGDLGTSATSSGGQQNKHRTRVGTLDHSAPEVLDGSNRGYDRSCDVYSFGICLWSLFSGMPLYPGYTMFDIISRVIEGQRPSLDFIPSQRLASIIQACWDQDPSKRPTFPQLVETLSQLDDKDFTSFA
jgi:ABC-type phosphate transport system substrate-binding protein